MALSEDGLSSFQADAGAPPLVERSIGRALDEAARDAPEQEAVVVSGFEDLGFSGRRRYGELCRDAEDVARALVGSGLSPGDRVAIWAPNVPSWLVVEFGAAKAGLVLVPLNPTYKAAEVRYLLADTGARALFLLPRFRQFAPIEELARVRRELPALEHVVSIEGEAAAGSLSYADFLDLGSDVGDDELRRVEEAVGPSALAQIQYTSGTTGRPKGAMLTHFGLLNNARQFAARWRVTQADRWANALPLFHTAGCAMVTLACVEQRATHCPAVWFDPRRVLSIVEEERCSIVETVPTMVTALLEAQRREPRELRSLRIVGTGGAPVPAALGRRVRAELGTELRSVYGLTETSPLVSAAPLEAPGDSGYETAGPPLGHTSVRIVDPSGRPVPVGHPGELQVRGYLVMAGYLNRPEATAEVLDEEGWFSTGDLARSDADGWLRIVDRMKDVVIRGGENLYPAEIEASIAEHPLVAEVCVVGVPDDYYGEEACAVVRLLAGAGLDEEELRRFLSARVTHQKVPRHVLFVEAFPTTESGKIKRRDVAERVRRELVEEVGSPARGGREWSGGGSEGA